MKTEVAGCRDCPFYSPDSAGMDCRHPWHKAWADLRHVRGVWRKYCHEQNALQAASLPLWNAERFGYDDPTDARPGVPDICPLIGNALVIDLRLPHWK